MSSSSSSSAERSSLSKRSTARTRTVSGSESEASCGRTGNGSVVPATAATAATAAIADSDNVSSNISPDRLKRKKRRKNVYDFSKDESKLRRRVLESGRRKKLEHEMIDKFKLKTAFVQLVRLEDERRLQERQRQQEQQLVAIATQPKPEEARRDVDEEEKRENKREEENKAEERLRLPGLTLPAEVDPRILQQKLVVKINKHQTEKLLQSKRRQQQISAGTSECADRLTEKLTDGCSSDNSNKCTKNANVSSSNSGRKVARIPVDKSNNDRLPDKLLKDDSKCTTDSATPAETSAGESQPESSKSFVNSCKRQKCNSLDQNSSDKQSVNSLEGRPKCPEEAGERHPEGSAKDAKRYSKNLIKDVNEKQSSVSASGDAKKDDKQQSELPCEKSKKVSTKSAVVESHPRPRRNLASKNSERHLDDSVENNQSDKPLAENEKLSEQVDKSIQDSSKSQSDSHKKITRKAAEKHESHVVSAVDSKTDDIKKSVEERSRKHSKRLDRKIECSKNETDNSKRVAKRVDDENEKSSGNITKSCVNYIANSVDEPEKLPEKLVKDVKVCIENQIDNVIKHTIIGGVKSDKPTEHVLENDLNGTQNVIEEISNSRSQSVDNNIQFSKNFRENDRTIQKVSKDIAHIVDESNSEHSKNSDIKVTKTLKIGIENNKKQDKINIVNGPNEKFVENSIDIHSHDAPNIVEMPIKNDSIINKESKNVPEINQRSKRRLAAKTREVNTEVPTEDRIYCEENSVVKTKERLNKNSNKDVTECKNNLEIGKRRTRKVSEKKDDRSETLIENNADHTQQLHEDDKEKNSEKSNIEENTKLQTETIKKVKRKSTLEIVEHFVEENQKVLPDEPSKTVKNLSNIRIEKKIATRSSHLKQEQHTENPVENTSTIVENSVLEHTVNVSSNTDKMNCDANVSTNPPPARKRGRPRKVLPISNLTNAEVLVKNNLDSQQNLVEKVDERSKLSNESKMITRKSLHNRHEKPTENLVKHDSNSIDKSIEINKDRLQLPEESQEIVKICSKSQTENQKRVTRKSSPDKHERQAIDNSDNKISEKAQKKVKECLKIQSEGLKRVSTRKSAPDNHEKHPENFVVNNLELAQNATDDHDQILSEKLDNKENSKTQIEIKSRITRCLPIKRDRQSKNLVENNVDCIQTLVVENRDKSSENLVNNLKVFPNTKKLRKNSIDKTNETNSEFSVENDITSAHGISDENIDNHTKAPEYEINKKTKRNCISKHAQNNTDNNLPDPQYLIDSTDGKLASTDENNIYSMGVVTEYSESGRQSEEFDKNIKNLPNGRIDYEFAKSLAEEILSCAERLIESNELCKNVLADVENNKGPKMDTQIHAEESEKEDADDQSLANRYQKEIESIYQNRKESADYDNNKCESVNQDAICCPKKIVPEQTLETSENQFKQCAEQSSEPTDNLYSEVKESTIQSDYESIENPSKSFVAYNEMNSLVSIGASTTNSMFTEDFDEVIKYFCIPAKNKIRNNDKNVCQTLKESVGGFPEPTTNGIDDSLIDINSSLENTLDAFEIKKTENTKNIRSALTENAIDTFGSQFVPRVEEAVKLSSTLSEIHAEDSVHNHETTLVELRKKCTENLERRCSASQENFTDSPAYQILPAEDSGDVESDKSSSSSDSSGENGETESEEGNYPDSVDSDENLADRLAQLHNLEIPPLNSSDDADSGVQTTAEEHQQHKRIDKIVLRCPRRSFLEMNAIPATAKLEFDCKDCDKSFVSNRELRKHIKVQHRQRLVIKIRKTDENKHAAHIVEQPVPKRLSKEQEDDDEDEGNASASPEKLDEDELARSNEDERITEGDIKIIVRKEGGSKNSHVIKEIKITPKSNSDGGNSTRIPGSSPARSDFGSGCSSSRIPGSSPARSDLGSSIGGGNSCRMPGNSPARFDIAPATNPVKRGRGRPKKYPIFTEAELIAKHLGSPTNSQVNNGATSARKKKDESPFIVEGIFGKRNEDEPLFEAVESIVVRPEFLLDSPQNDAIAETSLKINDNHAENQATTPSPAVEEAPRLEQPIVVKETGTVEPCIKRKRGRTLSQESLISAEAIAAAIVQEEKKRKVAAEGGTESGEKEFADESRISLMPERSVSEPDLRAKYHITKELVVQLTKLDTVPKENEDDSADDPVDDETEPTNANNDGEAESADPMEETPQRKTKPKIIESELIEVGGSPEPDIRAVIRLNLRRKLESNNNNLVVVNSIDKCLTPSTSDSPQHIAKPDEIASVDNNDATEESNVPMEIQAAPQVAENQTQLELQAQPELQPQLQPELQPQLQPELQQQTLLQLAEMPAKPSTSKNSCGDCNCEFHIDDDFDAFEDNQTLVPESEQQLIAAPQPPMIEMSMVDAGSEEKLHMLMNAQIPCDSVNNVSPTVVSQSLHFHSQVQGQPQVQPQVQVQIPLPPLIRHRIQYQPQQIQPQVQQLPQAQIQLPSHMPLPPLTQIQMPPQSQVPVPSQTQVQLPPQAQVPVPSQTQVQLPPQAQVQLPPHPQLLQLQQATESIQAQIQLPPQAQLVQLNQSQQFCILFFPESDGSNSAKDRPTTATIVNFQPVPDNEIANKPLIYMPTTPTKISIDDHAKQYVCATCSQVLDIIGRLEASLGMTEEDKSVIKCPYCSNHFQSLFYLEYHMMQEHLKCENEKQCRHASFSNLRIPSHEVASEFEIYITFALKCRSCYDIFNTVLQLNDHVMHKHKTLVRLKPSSPPFPATPSAGPAFPPGSPFVRKNSGPTHVAVLQCPSDCVCRIGIRSTDSPLQRQQMLKRCPNAMRRLEKIEPAAYEVYTCTLCKSTFLMKDEVVDHLMKMHEVSCKYPCYTCLTSFRSLQMQENHRCSETTLQDLDKLLSIAILPVNVTSSSKDDRSKYLEREDSSTDEYDAIKTAAATASNNRPSPAATQPQASNGYKRKNGETVAALQNFLMANAAKRAKFASEPMTTVQIASYRRRRVCPKCKLKFANRQALQHHVVYDHVLKGDVNVGPRKIAIDLLRILTADCTDGESTSEINEILKGLSNEDANLVKNLMSLNMDEENRWESSNGNDSTNGLEVAQCSNCKTKITLSAETGNPSEQNNHQQSNAESTKLLLCEGCENGGPKTRRRTVVNNGHHDIKNTITDAQGQPLAIIHPYACKKCSESFPSLLELKFHKRSTHNVDCDICKRSFTSLRMLEKHKKTHRESSLEDLSKTTMEDDNTSSSQIVSESSKDNSEANDSLNEKGNSSNRRDSSDSSSGTSKEPEEQPLNCSFCEEVCSSKVSLKNHLKREHGRRASICQFCNGLLIDTSEVRHMLDYHIVPSKSTSRSILAKSNGTILHCEASCMQDDVEELVRTLGKHRLQSLMMYHDFEGKCNNAIMRCPMCPELFATRESCRFHYVWIHDDTCLLCDETFRSGSSAFQHKVDAHTSTASYLWCIQRLVTAIVYTLRLDPDQPSHVLYQMLAMRIENEEAAVLQAEQVTVRGATGTTEKTGSEEPATDPERFGLEAVVLSEDQLPDSSNIIEVVIGKEDSEDDLLSMLNLSPSYESCSEQHRMPNAGSAPPEEEEDEETVAAAAVAAMAVSSAPTTPILSSAAASVTTTPTGPTNTTASPVVDNYVTSGVCKYRLENDEEQLVLVVTDDDLVTFRDDIGSLAERISTTCDSLTLDEITEMLRAYFESVNGVTSSGASA
ncbi:uncharacterized protein LOC100678824 isoform X1 [Nasonia vitripennis]|uniref:C2H2-type domain-containing protein n=1 Tax=Nasonia vitripennis TaxID=7425 RepID=A0A7M7QU26_NASVI|nr:uncharacterized protein LOC100678824 isoform X1 [Nasonia vitripennis]XP_031783822.1 uncharacterized protein LOC100678824 isoform X1 [Nasonia vitripennis]XP_031783823.1 uncharacterized protein LOC100678824 isoform X1 [Nasonia vitripennis]XP_031783824.1 uncharacterized protein LOC100678824 isoform X1 [Nasonia vitripennis]XP_031783825.1 uncharacterized protein LOC100678824 isoform X1 [Nasonia vitripennis]XP_032453705.1 uncharacterized protein LOC100678824 isoform X1 [Nasonia vitripennis]XP_03